METATQAPAEILGRLDSAQRLLGALGVEAPLLATAREAAVETAALTQDAELAVATLLHWVRRDIEARAPAADRSDGALDGSMLEDRRLQGLGREALRAAAQLERIGELRLPGGWSSGQRLGGEQAEVLRKMLLATAADPRLVVARLAERLVQLRHARELPEAEQQRLALESRLISAPLANRLGVWDLKWELEDLAFRQLEPEEYRRIARALAERRVDRERYITALCATLERELAAAGVHATAIYGRPKHIYSIWNKMQRKHVGFEQVFDVRAIRIIVESIADCYAALGVVHGLWRYIPGEFDDYIATPKDNDYRSIHTAVMGPEGKPVEVQIRSRQMHEQAELGIAAHWRYKEGGARDAGYERKIEWVRRVLDPAQSVELAPELERLKQQIFSDRIYAMTPRGDVVDLPQGATPLDFAYHLHTELGHRCRGAKVNGRIVPLHQPLANGDVVEIIAAREGAPSRDWLSAEQHYLASPRSRAKVRAWFRRLEQPADTAAEPAESPAPAPTSPAPQLPARRRPRRASSGSLVRTEGVGDLPVTLARCCAPVPGEPIAGYLAPGRGVTVHRASCANLLRMRSRNPERMLLVEWNQQADRVLPVRLRVQALDRRGLLRDVTDVMALEKLSIDGVQSETDPADRIATIVMRTAVRDNDQLARVLQRLGAVPNVLSAQRLT